MPDLPLIIAVLLVCTMLMDTQVKPRAAMAVRSLAGLWLHGLAMLAAFGLVLALCGNPLAAAATVLIVLAALVLGSNAKHLLLGEPIVFSDLALVRALFQHPQFYFTALNRGQLLALAAGALAVPAAMAWLFVPAVAPHLWGLAMLGGAVALLAISLRLPPWRHLAPVPDADADVARHGLVATIILHWQRWRASSDPSPSTATLPAPANAALVVIIQCESFADPAELFDDPAFALPGLTAARESAWLHGRLQVSGFGAYTNRTEYGVIFGLDEDALGFRRFDPYLTAIGEASHALPARLARSGWRSLFVHPHDLRFYARNLILPAAGFAELIGPERFAPPTAEQGRYVSDAAITDQLLEMIAAASGPTMLHAVTIENHGPWPLDAPAAVGKPCSAYLKLVRRGDAMLARLHASLAARQQPAMLLFYGDHRPSIPGVACPDGPRHTPFVLLRFGADGQAIRNDNGPCDLSPAQLHHALIAALTVAVTGA